LDYFSGQDQFWASGRPDARAKRAKPVAGKSQLGLRHAARL
jgi:hypothetical protein